jgi:quercetin dioxygenase-like cupin family protein
MTHIQTYLKRPLLAGTLVLTACAVSFAAGRSTQVTSTAGATFASGSGMEIKVLLDQGTLGAQDIDIAEITFPAGTDSGDHPHGATEIFYVLSGELEHIVNGESTTLRPGMVGFVRPPDRVNHKTSVETKALVLWVPGGEAQRIVRNWKRR